MSSAHQEEIKNYLKDRRLLVYWQLLSGLVPALAGALLYNYQDSALLRGLSEGLLALAIPFFVFGIYDFIKNRQLHARVAVPLQKAEIEQEVAILGEALSDWQQRAKAEYIVLFVLLTLAIGGTLADMPVRWIGFGVGGSLQTGLLIAFGLVRNFRMETALYELNRLL